MVSYDMLKTMKRESQLPRIFPKIIKMLEFDRINMLFSFIQSVIRKNKIAKAEESGKQLILKSAVVPLQEVGKSLTLSILGLPPKVQDSLEIEFSEYDTTAISKNPIISSLISISARLNSETEEKQVIDYQLQIKVQICCLINCLQDKR
jgi:hypothetical protein